MKKITQLAVALCCLLGMTHATQAQYTSPLAGYSAEWNEAKYETANTAAKAGYMSANEKEVIHVLNLVRMNPKLFAETVLPKAKEILPNVDMNSARYYKSLVKELLQAKAMKALLPDSLCTVSARCHALTSGAKSYTGHTRQTKECERQQHLMGECCAYGTEAALGVVLQLLIDEDVPSLGHRQICLDSRYNSIGVAQEAHGQYTTNCVLDFY
jgi:uncharacterized protein YkwD